MAIESLNKEFINFEPNDLIKEFEDFDYSYDENYESDRELSDRLGFLWVDKWKEFTLNDGLVITRRKQFIKKTYRMDSVIAYDTETYKGACKLLCRNEGKITSVLNPSFKECLDFLFYNADNSNVYRFFYNIDFDISAILKLWKDDNALEQITHLKNGIEINYDNYSLKWLKGRMFILKHITRRKSVIFTDLFNFFHLGLNKVAEKYLNEIKIDDIDGKLLNTSLDYWNEREQDIINYCVQDCVLTANLGKYLIKSIESSELPLPRYLVSSASLSKQYFRLNSFIPSIDKIPKQIIQIAYDTYYGGRFEMFKRGFFNNLYLYDINSQYPSFIRDLPNLRDGNFKAIDYIPTSKEIIDDKQGFPYIAFFKVKVNIPHDYKIPTIPIFHKGVNKFPVGVIEKWLTWYDIDLIRDYVVEVSEGYEFQSNPKLRKVFTKEIDNLFKKKQALKGKCELEYNLTKLCMNALYGCFIETHKNQDIEGNIKRTAGIMFNSVYASQITAFGRWSVIKDVPKDKYKHVIAIHTDSLITDIPMDEYLSQSLELGDWCKETSGKGIIINTGMYQIGYVVKTRGIPKRFIGNWLRFCLKFQIYKKKSFEIESMRKLSSGLIRDKSLINVNTMVDNTRSVCCNSDTKRHWIKDFVSFQEVLTKSIDSFPYYFDNKINSLIPNRVVSQVRFNTIQI